MELFRKVYIKSKADLPKEFKFYVFGFKNSTVRGMNYYRNDDKDILNLVDWYLVPFKLDMPTDEEIEGEAMTYSSYPAMPDGHPEFEPSRAPDFDAGAKWMGEEIKKRNK